MGRHDRAPDGPTSSAPRAPPRVLARAGAPRRFRARARALSPDPRHAPRPRPRARPGLLTHALA